MLLDARQLIRHAERDPLAPEPAAQPAVAYLKPPRRGGGPVHAQRAAGEELAPHLAAQLHAGDEFHRIEVEPESLQSQKATTQARNRRGRLRERQVELQAGVFKGALDGSKRSACLPRDLERGK